LHFDVIPQQVDDYLSYLEKYVVETAAVGQPMPEGKQANSPLDNPVWHIHGGKPPAPESNVKFSLLLNLVSACNAEDKAVLWSFLKRELPNATPENSPMLDKLCGYAVRYFHDFVKPTKKFRAPNETERLAMGELREYLTTLPEGTPSEEIQTRIYDIGMKYYSKETLREWFKANYELLLGSSQGPRMGSFIALFGAQGTIGLIDAALAQKAAA
jgi:lysyl-tRNA synthetase, class I